MFELLVLATSMSVCWIAKLGAWSQLNAVKVFPLVDCDKSLLHLLNDRSY